MSTFKFNARKPKAHRMLEHLQSVIGGALRISRRGVPHLVINNFYSIAYFCKNKEFAIFANYATPDNHRVARLKTSKDVVNYFKFGWERQ